MKVQKIMSNILVYLNSISSHKMLNHCFYKHYWNNGLLNREILAKYVVQYYYIEKTFIECLEILLKKSKQENNLKFNKVIEENLQEELGKASGLSHLSLLLDFGKEFGLSEDDIHSVELNIETKLLINNFKNLCENDLISGIGVMFGYEHQIPKIAESKIATLKQFYGVSSQKSLAFFKTHLVADVWHAQQWESLIKDFNHDEMASFKNSLAFTMINLNYFLDGMMRVSGLEMIA